MNGLTIDKFAQRMAFNPIARSPKLTAGNYAVQKVNDDYSIIAEINGKWTQVKESDISKVPTDARWIMFNNVLNHKDGKQVQASVNLLFKELPVKSNLLMQVNDKGYTNIDLKALKPEELKAFKSEVIEEPTTF